MQHEKQLNQAEPDFSAAALVQLDALYGFAMVLTRNRTEAEDLVQETYLRASRAFGRLLPDSNLKSWLFAIMRNIWLNQVRHARLTGPLVELDAEVEKQWQWPAQDHQDPHFVLLQKVQRAQVRAAVERLPASRLHCTLFAWTPPTSRRHRPTRCGGRSRGT